jgi:hypothetical protein
LYQSYPVQNSYSRGIDTDYRQNSLKTSEVSGENKDMSKWINKYLGVGEWVMDQSVALAGSSSFFERTR